MVFEAAIGERRVILKQPMPKLAVQQEWLADVDRAQVEADALLAIEPLVGSVPRLIDFDSARMVMVMESLGTGGVTWRTLLLDGVIDPTVGRRAGEFLARAQRTTLDDEVLRARFSDRRVFNQLRLDPFYARLAAVHPMLEDALAEMLERMEVTSRCLVHGDFTPKNLLVLDEVWVLDWEIAHFGDPTYDIASCGAHLLLKAMSASGDKRELLIETFESFMAASRSPRVIIDERHLCAQLTAFVLARIDGKSPVDYLSEHMVRAMRALALDALTAREVGIQAFVDGVRAA